MDLSLQNVFLVVENIAFFSDARNARFIGPNAVFSQRFIVCASPKFKDLSLENATAGTDDAR